MTNDTVAPDGTTSRRALTALVASLHERLHAMMRTPSIEAQTANEGGDDYSDNLSQHPSRDILQRWFDVWDAVPTDDAEAYAQAMSTLFSTCYEVAPHVLSIVEGYFKGGHIDYCGTVAADADRGIYLGVGHRSVCGRGAAALKACRRAFFSLHGRTMNADEVAAAVLDVNEQCAVKDGDRIVVLDVGSCHGALQRSAPAWMHVVSVDLHPANSCVLRGDWLSVSVEPPLAVNEAPIEKDGADCDGWYLGAVRVDADMACTSSGAAASAKRLVAVSAASVDVVLMSYMLSYLPDGMLRWYACAKAASVLRPGGLLIILEPRRGAHHNQWCRSWSTTLSSSFGLHLHHQEIRTHTVTLVMVRQGTAACPGGDAVPLEFSSGGTAPPPPSDQMAAPRSSERRKRQRSNTSV